MKKSGVNISNVSCAVLGYDDPAIKIAEKEELKH